MRERRGGGEWSVSLVPAPPHSCGREDYRPAGWQPQAAVWPGWHRLHWSRPANGRVPGHGLPCRHLRMSAVTCGTFLYSSLGQTFTGQTKSLIPSSSTFAWKKSMTCLCLSSLTLFGLPLPSPYTFLQYSAMWPTVTSLRSRLSFNWVGRFR